MNKIWSILKTQTIKDSILIGLGTFSTAFFGFIFTVLMARSLSPEKFGVFSALTSLVAILYSLGDLGVGPAIISFLPRNKKSENKIISTTFWFQYLVSVSIAITIWLLARFSGQIIPGSTAEHFYLIGSLCFNYILIGWVQSILTAKRYFLKFSLSQIIDSIIKISLVYYLYLNSGLSISLALLANSVSVSVALFLTFGKDLAHVPLKFSKKTFSKLFRYSKWIALSRFFTVLNSKVDILLLNLLGSSFQAGIFAAASRVTLLFAVVVSSLSAVVNPRFSSFKSKKDFMSYTKKLFYLISGISILLVVLVLFANQIIMAVFGSSFFESIKVFQLLSLAMIPFLYSIIPTAALLYTFQDSSYYALMTFINISIILAFDLFGISKIGYMAPILGLFIANCSYLLLSFLKLKKHYQTKLK